MRCFLRRGTVAGIFAVTVVCGLAGCQPARIEGGGENGAMHLVGNLQVEPTMQSSSAILRYGQRSMEVKSNRFGQVRLDDESQQNEMEGKRILLEELSVTVDLSREQWTKVFAEWFSKQNALPAATALFPTPVTIKHHAAWQYTVVAAREDGRAGSCYWRVYLFPRGRTACVLRSVGWEASDSTKYNHRIDELAADVETP